MSWPWRQEQTHAMLVGSTGTGKTVAMMDLLDQIRARGHRSIVFDLTGAYISTYFDPSRGFDGENWDLDKIDYGSRTVGWAAQD